MKRSEMLEKIHSKLLDQPMTDDWPNQILSAMESLGMQPPTYELRDGMDAGKDVIAWESEDANV